MLQERELFIEAIKLGDPASRVRFIQETCSDDAALHDRLNALLEAHHDASEFLTNGNENFGCHDDTHDALAGTTIDRYKLLEQIGEGGFGVVYMAEQQVPVQRRVALKIIKPGMDSQQVVARFEAERQALAMMDHPNIARVLDAGSTKNGRPYFVMELVNGKPIIDFCDKRKLSTDDRLELFCQVCRAIQHAHQKGVIHRDIKPSNVLVTTHDTVAMTKVIDFGIAKAISHRLTEKTLFTRFGQMIGTPQYMSPEQAEMNDLDVDTRTDVYSLGVLLYELLTGTTPVDGDRLRAGGLVEMLRIIREDEPLIPSSRVSTLGDTAPKVCDQRGTEPARLGRRLRGDLDWIVMKALEKDRSRRYETASALGEDVRRHLEGEVVEAGPPTASYRFRKFVHRNRSIALATAAFIGALLIGLAATLVSLNEAVKQTTRASAAAAREAAIAAKSRQTLDLILEMFRSVDPTEGKGPSYTARDWLDEFSSKLDERLADQPGDAQAEIRHTIGMAYMRLNMQYSANPHIVLAADQYRDFYGRHKKTADCLIDLAMANVLLCEYGAAEQSADEAMSIYNELGIQSEVTDHAKEILQMADWSQSLRQLVHEDTLNFRHEEVNGKVDRILKDSKLRPVGTLLARIFSLKLDVGDFEATEALAKGRITKTMASVDNSPLREMTERMGRWYLGSHYQFCGRDDEAEAVFLTLKNNAMNYVPQEDNWMKMMYAWALLHCGKCGGAELQRALELATDFAVPIEEFAAMSQIRYFAYHTLAAAHARSGDYDKAVEAERIALVTISPQHLFHRGQGEVALSQHLIAKGHFDQAEQELQAGVLWRDACLPEGSLQRATGEMNLAEFYLKHRSDAKKAAPLLAAAASRLTGRPDDDFYVERLRRLSSVE